MRDIDIRLALDDHIRSSPISHGGVLRHELGLEEGRRRIDVALINGHLRGWEIKSDVDTLNRLAGQAESYGKVFDYVTLVTTDRFLDKARAKLPEWWGLTIARFGEADEVVLEDVRAARSNAAFDAMAVAQLLWRDEALDILRELDAARGLSGKARWYVWARLVEVLPVTELCARVRDVVRERPEWSGGRRPSERDARTRTLATA